MQDRIPHSALNMETPYKLLRSKDADLSHLRIIGAREFVHIKDVNTLGHTSWEGMLCGFSQNESNSFRFWNPKTRRVVESRNFVFIEAPSHLRLPSWRISPLQGLEALTLDFYDKSLDYNYSSRNHSIQNAKDYTSALEFEANEPLHIPTPGGSSPGAATSQGLSSAAPVPAPAPETMSAPVPALKAPQATATGTDRYGIQPGVTRAIARGQVRTSAATNSRANRNNRTALASLFQKDTV